MSIVKEVYLTARNEETSYSLEEVIQQRKDAEQRIFEEVNKIADLTLIDLISMMIPIVVAPLKKPEYFSELIAGASGITHASIFTKMAIPELADTQRLIQTLFGLNEKQKFLFSLKSDPNSPSNFSVKKVLLVVDSTVIDDAKGLDVTRALRTLGIPEGMSVSVLFDDQLTYTPEQPNFDSTLLSNLINTYVLTTLAVSKPEIFTGKFDYKISAGRGRSTYIPDPGEVLFVVHQTSEAPASWFDIFDKVELEDFDLKTELSKLINRNLVELTHKCLD